MESFKYSFDVSIASEIPDVVTEEEHADMTIDFASYWSEDDDGDDQVLDEIVKEISAWAAEMDREESERHLCEEAEEEDKNTKREAEAKAREAEAKAKLYATLDAEFEAVHSKYLAKKEKKAAEEKRLRDREQEEVEKE